MFIFSLAFPLTPKRFGVEVFKSLYMSGAKASLSDVSVPLHRYIPDQCRGAVCYKTGATRRQQSH